MAKAFRTDVLGKKQFQGEIEQRSKTHRPESVPCPSPGCTCTYEMFGANPANLENYTAILQKRVQLEHPGHTSEVLSVNEFRKRQK